MSYIKAGSSLEDIFLFWFLPKETELVCNERFALLKLENLFDISTA